MSTWCVNERARPPHPACYNLSFPGGSRGLSEARRLLPFAHRAWDTREREHAMKRIFSYAIFGLAFAAIPAVLGGCPIYSDDHGNRVCLQSGECYSCPGTTIRAIATGTSAAMTATAPAARRATRTAPVCQRRLSDDGRWHNLLVAAGLRARRNLRVRQSMPVRRLLQHGMPERVRLQAVGRHAPCVGGTSASDAGKDTGKDTGKDGAIIPKVSCHNDGECSPLGGGDDRVPRWQVRGSGQSVLGRNAVPESRAVRAGRLHPVVRQQQTVPHRLRVRREQGVYRQSHPLRRCCRRWHVRERHHLRGRAMRDAVCSGPDLRERPHLHRRRLHS